MQHWLIQAEAHWREFLPKKVAALEKAGTLKLELYQAAKQTMDELTELEAQGLTFSEAREMVIQQYLLLPPEPEVTATLEEGD